MQITKESARQEINEALMRGDLFAGTLEFERLADMARAFCIEVPTVLIRTEWSRKNLEIVRTETPSIFPPKRKEA
jgi:hypothetical protein